MKLSFFGGVGEATGANYILESGSTRIMIDCGLHQGSHYASKENFEPFPYDPRSIAAVFITHAHLDHIGRLPSLVKAGFTGAIYSTSATKDFAELMLLDSEHILFKESEREHKPPLYDAEDINHTLALWHRLAYHQQFTVGDFTVEPFDAGHILGSAFYKITESAADERASSAGGAAAGDGHHGNHDARQSIVFSGDLGNFPALIIKPTEMLDTVAGDPARTVDYCVIESTYGDRTHANVDQRREMLERAVEDTAKAGGTLMIPTFALERTQEMLYHLHQLFKEGRIPRIPVFIDSPLAIKLTAIYKKYESLFNAESQHVARRGDDILNFPGLRLTLTTEQSKEINDVTGPKIVIAGSGMSNGGRILHHEMRYLPDPKSSILFVGYQAEATLGRLILDGATEVHIFGETVPVRCKVLNIPGYSAHADQPHLLDWLKHMKPTLKRVFVVQGEQQSSEVLAGKIRDEMAVRAEVPVPKASYEL